MTKTEDFGTNINSPQLTSFYWDDADSVNNTNDSSFVVQPNDHEVSLTNEKDFERINAADYPRAFRRLFILVAIVCSIFLVSFDMTIVATAIPRISDEF